MTDCILLLRSNYQGYPQPGGPTAHFVRVGAATMHTVNQMTSGGRWPGSDCAVADMQSVLLDRGLHVPVLSLEAYANTSQYGTTCEGIVYALAKYKVASHIVQGNPQPDWVMNPAWGGLLAPSQFQAYLAASLRVYVQIDDVAPVGTTIPVVGQPEAAISLEAVNPRDVFWRGGAHTFKIVANGNLQHHWFGPTAWNGPEILATGLVSGQHIEANVAADGSSLSVSVNRPDGRTARFTQFQPQPAGQPSWREDEIT
jgi:hypothetical protein